jgi:hypothetical protein
LPPLRQFEQIAPPERRRPELPLPAQCIDPIHCVRNEQVPELAEERGPAEIPYGWKLSLHIKATGFKGGSSGICWDESARRRAIR